MDEKDLLEFSRQIAAGMVRTWYMSPFSHVICTSALCGFKGDDLYQTEFGVRFGRIHNHPCAPHKHTQDFLASLDIVHRDLACRNILVGEKKNLKISDFGMSRYVPTDEVYVPTSHGLLPLRWMAIESLLHREFTTSSDVWSYGIVLWEICTMGNMFVCISVHMIIDDVS